MSLVTAATALLAIATLAAPAGHPVAAANTGLAWPAAPAEVHVPPEPLISASWTWPLQPRPDVLRPFAPPEQRWLPGHRGVDLLAPGPGASVLAPAEGRIRFSGRVAGKDVVVIEHAGGLRSTFEPAASSLQVGAAVTRGQAVASIAPTPGHCTPTTCLHWGVLRGEVYLDPLALLGSPRVRLLPPS